MRRAATILVACAALALAGCGYRPLYGSSVETAGVSASLSSVAIPEADTRLGQLIRNDLLSSMGSGSGGERYTLVLKPTVKRIGVIQKSQPNVTRQAVNVSVSFDLVERATGSTVHSGKTFSQASFDVVRQPFADMQAETNANERAAHEVAADIRTRLAAYFANRTPAQ